ncbi:carbohydrate ABC transporter permease [Microbacterium sp. NPDC096154]|uniref:carbohydrate ABC transporter permease n=1 Tax=Microbacterium sp. NPDC096154 TaxID=3155549 RepID=UPI003325DBB8
MSETRANIPVIDGQAPPLPPAQRWAGLIQSAFLVVIALVALIPIIAIFLGTFQDGGSLLRSGVSFAVDVASFDLDSYRILFTESGDYFLWFWNSLWLTAVQVVLTLLVSSFVSYGLAMYDFRGKQAVFIAVLIVMTVPFEMMMLPLYMQVNDFDLADTFIVIFLPFLAHAMTIFFFRQYFLGVPYELVEAGRVDGVSEFGIFFRLVLPIAKPAIAAMAILNGMLCWNNFLWPLLVLRSSDKFILPIGLNALLTPHGNNYDLLIVGAFFSLVPILLLFLAFQRYFIEGMTAGAVKG